MNKQLIEQAIDALEKSYRRIAYLNAAPHDGHKEAILALRAERDKVVEPVGIVDILGFFKVGVLKNNDLKIGTKLYAHPPEQPTSEPEHVPETNFGNTSTDPRCMHQKRIENTQNLYTSEQRVQKTAESIHVTEEEEEAFRAITNRLSPT